jgi:hypothetical protein
MSPQIHPRKPILLTAAVGLAGVVLLTGCGAEPPRPVNAEVSNATASPSPSAGPYLTHPELSQVLARDRGLSRQRRTPRSEVRDSPCFMNPDHWDYYLEDGYPVCVTR